MICPDRCRRSIGRTARVTFIGPMEAGRDLPFHLLRRQLLEVPRVEAGRIVDQHVDAAEALDCGSHRRFGLGRTGDVQPDGQQVGLAPHRRGWAAHETAIPQLKLYPVFPPHRTGAGPPEPAVYVVVQGHKEVTVGDRTYVYDPSQYLAVAVDLPVFGRVVVASPEEPYLCMTLEVDPREARGADRRSRAAGTPRRSRWAGPLRQPARGAPCSPLSSGWCSSSIRRRTSRCWRRSSCGSSTTGCCKASSSRRLAQMAIGDGRLRRVAGAIAWIKEHFAEPLQVETLAKRVHLSPSALHSLTSKRSRQ